MHTYSLQFFSFLPSPLLSNAVVDVALLALASASVPAVSLSADLRPTAAEVEGAYMDWLIK